MTVNILVLLAEDDADVALVLEASLSDAGYEVILAKDGAAALREIDADAARFRAVVTDIRLGSGPDGWQVGQRVRHGHFHPGHRGRHARLHRHAAAVRADMTS
jgi:DNA-binding response OmpR family regulator